MPNIVSVLNKEIARISRKEARKTVAPLRSPLVRARRFVAELKRRVVALEKANRDLVARLAKVEAAQPAASAEAGDKARVTAKGLRSLRRKLGVSQAELGQLIGITGSAVGHLEKLQGALNIRSATRAALLSIRGLGARAARKQLAELAPSASRTRRGSKGTRRGRKSR